MPGDIRLTADLPQDVAAEDILGGEISTAMIATVHVTELRDIR